MMVDIMTGKVPDAVDDGKNAADVARGKAGGLKGSATRAAKPTPSQRAEIAKNCCYGPLEKAD